MKWTLLSLSLALLIAIGCSSSGDGKKAENATPNESSYAKVQAVLDKSCVGCHGEKNPKGGIDLRNHEVVMKGGEEGAIVVAGDPAKSVLVKALKGIDGVKKMPLRGEPLTEEQIKLIEAWIQDGAKS
jgi:mono/diheme cytochrome c family protein